jgi:hypothetical protein
MVIVVERIAGNEDEPGTLELGFDTRPDLVVRSAALVLLVAKREPYGLGADELTSA